MSPSNQGFVTFLLRAGRVACFILVCFCLSSFFSVGVAKDANAEAMASFHSSLQGVLDEAVEDRVRPDQSSILLAYGMFLEYALGSNTLPELSDNRLMWLYNAISPVVSLASYEEILSGFSSIVIEIERRGLDVDISPRLRSSDPSQFLYESYLAARLYESAISVADRYEVSERFYAIEALKGRSEEGQSALLRFEKEDSKWNIAVSPFDPNEGAKIIVVAHPDCGPSRQALEYFELDRDIPSDVIDRVHWVVPQSRTFPLSPVEEWNAAQENTELSVIYDENQWPQQIGTTGTPVFFFMKDGERKKVVEGWPDDDQFDVLASAARRIGIDLY